MKSTEKSWVLPLFNKFDTHDMLSTMTADGAGNRTTLDLIEYSLLVVDQHVGGTFSFAYLVRAIGILFLINTV